jgi:hypothetical protein
MASQYRMIGWDPQTDRQFGHLFVSCAISLSIACLEILPVSLRGNLSMK